MQPTHSARKETPVELHKPARMSHCTLLMFNAHSVSMSNSKSMSASMAGNR